MNKQLNKLINHNYDPEVANDILIEGCDDETQKLCEKLLDDDVLSDFDHDINKCKDQVSELINKLNSLKIKRADYIERSYKTPAVFNIIV